MPPRPFDLQDDVPDTALDPEWCTPVRQQACTLVAMLQRLQTAVASADRRPDAPQLQALAADAEPWLTAQAPQHVSLERQWVQLRALVAAVG